MRKLIVILIAVLAVGVLIFRNQQNRNTTVTTKNTTAVPQKRKVASVQNLTPERILLVDLIREKTPELRNQFNALPNKSEVLWSYYRDLQIDGSEALERLEVLELMNGSGGDSQLAEVALAEALEFSPDPGASPERVFDIFLNNCGSYEKCQQSLLTVIANTSSRNIRARLIAAVNKRFPQQQDEFAAELARYQLN